MPLEKNEIAKLHPAKIGAHADVCEMLYTV